MSKCLAQDMVNIIAIAPLPIAVFSAEQTC